MAVHEHVSPEYAVTSFFSIAPAFWEQFEQLDSRQQNAVQSQINVLALDLVRCLFAARDGLLERLVEEEPETAELVRFLGSRQTYGIVSLGACTFLLRRLIRSLSLVGVSASQLH